MTKRLLVSDANILIDIEVSGLTDIVFALEYEIAIPELLFHEEIAPFNFKYAESNLSIIPFDEKASSLLAKKTQHYHNIALSRNDVSAMVLALIKDCTLLTGDALLRTTAEREGLEVHGMLWLVDELFNEGMIDTASAKEAYDLMI